MYVFLSLQCKSRSEIAWLNSKSMFNFLRNCPTFSKQLHHSTFPQGVYEGSNFPNPYKLLLLSDFLVPAIRVGVKWYLLVVLI